MVPNEPPAPAGDMAWNQRVIVGKGPLSMMGEAQVGQPGQGAPPAGDEPDPAGGEQPGEPPDAEQMDPAIQAGIDAPVSPPPPALAEITAELLKDDPEVIDPDSLLLATDEDILKTATSRLMRAVAFKAHFETKANEGWQDWMLFLRGDSSKWTSKRFIPITLEQISSAIPSFVAAIFDSGKLFDVKSRTGAKEKKARVIREAVEFYFRTKMNAEAQVEDWVKYSLICGTGIMKTSWRRVKGVRREQEEVMVPMPDGTEMSAGTRMKNTHDAVLENRPVIEAVDFWNYYPLDYLDADGNPPVEFERVESTPEDMVNDAKAGLFGPDGANRIAKWLETNPEKKSPEGDFWGNASSRASPWGMTGIVSPFGGSMPSNDEADRPHAQIVYWIMAAKDYRICVSGDGTTVLGKMTNPFKHKKSGYTRYCFDRIPKSPLGRGVAEILSDIQTQINFNYNKGNDAAQLALNKPMLLRGAGNAGVTVVWQPGVIIRLRDTSDMVPLDVKNPMGEVQQMEAHLNSHADKATGLNDSAKGSAQPGINTATESANVQAQFRMRMSGHARNLRGAFSQIGQETISNIQQFIDPETAIAIDGENGIEWETIGPKDLVGEYDIVSTANFSKSNPSMIRQDLIAVAPIVLADPAVNHVEFLTRLFEGFDFDHVEKLVIQPGPPMRDPALEEMALDQGFDVDPSMDEVITGGIAQHLAVHLAAQQKRISTPGANPKAVQAAIRHIEKTMEMGSRAQQQAPPPGSGAQQQGGPAKKPPGGDEARQGASRLGKATGSDGRPGQSPGPQGVPKRPSPQNPSRESA